MRDTGGKMAELKFEAPLAKFEEADDWGTLDLATLKAGSGGVPDARRPADEDAINLNLEDPDNESSVDNALDNQHQERCVNAASASSETDNFQETFSGSLEDLVNTFDDKITRCFCNYDESVEKLAPVQVRSQEEIMNECQ
ncbi:hypothetical protein AAG570_008691 [Ranatra chinensis]|uniref:Uncharacterized protein n=1 Tax=Ranatra chinensis TaxID=642074 RepID=A0ABD0Z8R2_9HEMI